MPARVLIASTGFCRVYSKMVKPKVRVLHVTFRVFTCSGRFGDRRLKQCSRAATLPHHLSSVTSERRKKRRQRQTDWAGTPSSSSFCGLRRPKSYFLIRAVLVLRVEPVRPVPLSTLCRLKVSADTAAPSETDVLL